MDVYVIYNRRAHLINIWVKGIAGVLSFLTIGQSVPGLLDTDGIHLSKRGEKNFST